MFEMINNRQVIFGAGEVKRIPKLLAWYGCKKVFLAVYDKNAPVCGRIVKDLEKEGIGSLIFDRICGEPDTRLLNEGRDLFLSEGCDCTVAGGEEAFWTQPRPSVCWLSMEERRRSTRWKGGR